MNIKMNEVYTLKLTSGEELVTKIVESFETELLVSEPMSVAPGPQGMGLIPSLFTAAPNTETRLNKSTIALYALADETIKAKYIEAVSGLIVPQKKLILG